MSTSIKIAICDDNLRSTEELISKLHEYEKEKSLNFQIHTYTSGDSFIKNYVDSDIIFMDIYLGDYLGIDLIKSRDFRGVHVIFCTTSTDFAVEAFDLNATHYLVKPISPEKFRKAMDRALEYKIWDKEEKQLYIKLADSNVPIPLPISDIKYIEISGKLAHIVTTDKTYNAYLTLKYLEEALDDERFIRPQRSFIANMDFVDSFRYDKIIMDDGQEIVLSRSKRGELKKTYSTYLLNSARF